MEKRYSIRSLTKYPEVRSIRTFFPVDYDMSGFKGKILDKVNLDGLNVKGRNIQILHGQFISHGRELYLFSYKDRYLTWIRISGIKGSRGFQIGGLNKIDTCRTCPYQMPFSIAKQIIEEYED